jgi:hypothetical protein
MKSSRRADRRQRQRKHHPTFRSAGCRNGSTMELHEPFHDSEAETGSTGTTFSIRDSIVAVEHKGQMLGRHTRSVINHTDFDTVIMTSGHPEA